MWEYSSRRDLTRLSVYELKEVEVNVKVHTLTSLLMKHKVPKVFGTEPFSKIWPRVEVWSFVKIILIYFPLFFLFLDWIFVWRKPFYVASWHGSLLSAATWGWRLSREGVHRDSWRFCFCSSDSISRWSGEAQKGHWLWPSIGLRRTRFFWVFNWQEDRGSHSCKAHF
jgi:hypothetical protein